MAKKALKDQAETDQQWKINGQSQEESGDGSKAAELWSSVSSSSLRLLSPLGAHPVKKRNKYTPIQ